MNTPVTAVKTINGYEWGNEIGKGTQHLRVNNYIGAWGKVRMTVGCPSHCSEVELVQTLCHQNIIKYHELDDHTNPDKFYLFMELCASDISSAINTKAVFKQLLEGLFYLSTQNVAHHDIKTDNILITADGVVKISDFGVSERYDPGVGCNVFFGTPAFQAPEIAKNITGDPYDGHKADVWSAGVILYQIVTGELPFTGGSVYLLIKSIDNDPVRIPSLSDKRLRDLLTKLLAKEPENRPTAEEALQHPWFTEETETGEVGCCRIT
ncbi:Protein Smok3c [Paramicrosporidium saccamoebae]|uniref:Protein Smok3c n=1 Tax=Paramicrosporidium saccamoebae TaxID=1246581 RepID=A0A2H9TH42_9FUNG|nr:Protein Smok3c [Paramicrosporidium saccamoebae]